MACDSLPLTRPESGRVSGLRLGLAQDCFVAIDETSAVADEGVHKFKIYDSVADSLTLGKGKRVAVDGVRAGLEPVVAELRR